MLMELDHVTQFVRDRDATAEAYRAQGFNARPGGLHPKVGSGNNLCYFDLFYIEMLSVHDRTEAMEGPSEVCRAAVRFIDEGEGFGGIALETDDLAAAHDMLVAAGAVPGEVIEMQRRQADGFVSYSKILYPKMADAPVPLPIVIERGMGPEARREDLTAKGVVGAHDVGDLKIDSLVVAVPDHKAAADLLSAAYRFEPAAEGHDPALGGWFTRLDARRGDIVLVEPDGDGRAQERLRRGAGVYALVLSAADPAAVLARTGGGTDGFLPRAQLSEAQIRIVGRG